MKTTKDEVVLPREEFDRLMVAARNYEVLYDFVTDMPTGLEDIFPDWDFETGTVKEEEEEWH